MAGLVNWSVMDPTMPGKVGNSFLEGQQNALARAAQQQNMELQGYQLDSAKRAQSDDLATRQAWQSGGGDYAKTRANLLSGGQYQQVQAMDKARREQLKGEAELGKVIAETDASKFKLRKDKLDTAIKDITQFNTREEVLADVSSKVQSGELPQDKADSIIRSLPQDAAQFGTWKNGVLRNLMTAKEQFGYVQPDANATLQATTSTANNAATNQRMASEGALNRGVQVRGQDIKKTPAGKPLPVAALKMQQEELDAIGTAAGIQADLGAFEGQIKNGKLDFGPVSNLKNRGLNMLGTSTEESRNFASFKSSLEKLRNDSLRLNKGVQTDGDSQRAWNELFENINDKKFVQQRLGEIKRINERAVNIRKMNVDGIRANYGHDPVETSGYETQKPVIGKSIDSLLEKYK